MSIITDSCFELSAELEVRYPREGRVLFITMSKISGVAEGLFALMVGVSCNFIKQDLSMALS